MAFGAPFGGDATQFGGLPPEVLEALQQLQAQQQAQNAPPQMVSTQGRGSANELLYNHAPMGGGLNPFMPQDAGPATTGSTATPNVPVAMTEADARQMERGMLPPDARNVPLPPSRPSDADLMAPAPAPASAPAPTPRVQGMNPDRTAVAAVPGVPARPSVTAASTGNPDASNVQPVNSFDPLTGQVVSGNPKPMRAPGEGGPTEGAGRVAAAAGVPQAAGLNPGDLFSKFTSGLQNPDVKNLLLNVGIGLMSQRGFGPGIAAGLQGYQASRQGDLKQQLQMLQIQQQLQGQNAIRSALKAKGVAPEMIEAAALNPSVLSSVLSQQNQKTPEQLAADREAVLKVEQNFKDDKTITPLTGPDARVAAGINPNDQRPAWRDANGKVTFDDAMAPKPMIVRGPDGAVVKQYDPITRTMVDIPGGGTGPNDNAEVPAGVDPQTYKREMAKAVVGEKKAATDRGLMAEQAAPILDRAEKAYRTLAEGSGIGPFQSSGANRFFEGARGHPNEVARQDYEAAQKELELMKAQISMKGQGAITEGERKILATTLPRLDAADPKTGLETFTGLRGQFSRAQSAETLPRHDPKPPTGAPEGARQAKDGNWYVADPNRPGKYLMVR